MNSLSSWFSYDAVEKAQQMVGTAAMLAEQQLATATQLIANTALSEDCASLGLTYVTPRIIAGSFPVCAMYNGENGSTLTKRVVDQRLGNFLCKQHGSEDKVLVWNLSEVSYEGLSAIEFRFPGHPSAPLGALFELCTSLDSWLNADESNVALVHCLTGKGRTITVLACYLAWSGYRHMTPQQALSYVCEQKKVKVLDATIPSQRRYVEYFSRALDGVRPRSEAIMLKRARANGIPVDAILQVYVDGTLVYSGKGQAAVGKEAEVVSFPTIDTILDGDVLLRIRVENPQNKQNRVSLFRVAMHSGYTPSGTFRLEKDDLDGGSKDSWIELEFEPIPGTQSTAKLLSKGVATNEAAFWELVSKRRAEIRNKEVETGNAVFSIAVTPKPPSKTTAAATAVSTPTAGAMADHGLEEEDDEENEEDDLEKELGELLEGKKKTASASPAAAKQVLSDDLAELDDYFNALDD
ncbi:hypothetical protein BASA81_010260 [Batrachochytrium salamandrivorans]|nr:hypothetical protein BASA81_010260 [Batrachochytrium salamandrivorans]